MRRPVKGYEGYYSVTDRGEIFTDATGHKKKAQIHFGYESVGLFKKQKSQMKRVHRLVAEAFIPNPENKPDINHKNCIKTDNRVENLEWVTKQENNTHAWENGLNVIRYGVDTSCAKLENIQVLIIKEALIKGFRSKEIASYFKVDPSNISHIKRGKTWLC